MPASIYDELQGDLNLPEVNRRVAASKRVGELISTGEIARVESGELNNHVHTIYSFSPYSPSLAAFTAWRAGLPAVGIMDHDSVAGCDEMLDAAANIGIASTVGFELRVNMSGTGMSGQKLNNPDSPNIAYIAVHGIPRGHLSDAAAFLAPLQEARNKRNMAMTERLSVLSVGYGFGKIDFETDVVSLSQSGTGGSITERHVLYGLCKLLTDKLGKGEKIIDAVENGMEIRIPGKIRNYLADQTNPHYLFDLLGVFKSTIISRIYEHPGIDECVGVESALEFARSIGAITAYAYLGDVTDSPTGDKKAEKFEDEYLDELFDVLAELQFQAITYMPPRNTLPQLKRVQALCARHGFMEISGVDINSSRQSFNCPELLMPQFRHLSTSAWALIAHEKLSGTDERFGLFHPDNPVESENLRKRIGVYGAIGKKINHGRTALTFDAAESLLKEHLQ